MRAPVLRLIAVAFIAQMATACASYSAFNPFDDDPNGAPPAPHLFAGAYDPETDGPEIVDTRRPREERDYARNDDDDQQVAMVDTSREPSTRRVSKSGSDYDRSYGTNAVDSAPLAAPEDYREAPREEFREARVEEDAPPPAPHESGERTLNTGRAKSAPAAEKPVGRIVMHTVRSGEQLSDIADDYAVREVDIIAANGMKPPYKLAKGQELRVPVAATADAGPRPGETVKAGEVVPQPKPQMGESEVASAEPKPAKPAKAKEAAGPRFDWPVSGKIVSGYGARGNGLYNEGINIAVAAGTSVRASAGGVVRYAGNELRGYGNLVLIEHDGGFVTAYAHNESLAVKRGERVERGQVIAKSGQTGNVKSPQLHFEIRKGTESVDPSKYLTS